MKPDRILDATSPDVPALGFWQKLRDIGIVATVLAWLVWLVVPQVIPEDCYLALGQVQSIRYFGS